MLIDRNSKNEFVLNCFRELLDDGEPHRYREIIDYVREQAKGSQYENPCAVTGGGKQTGL